MSRSIETNETTDLEKQQDMPQSQKPPTKKEQQNNFSSSRSSRLLALVIGMGILGVVVLMSFLFLRDNSLKPKRSSSSAAAAGTVVSQAALATHNEESDCWLAIHGHTYDLTEYATRHPGGPGYIWDYCGTDATEAYDREHSESLLNTIPETRMGVLGGGENGAENKENSSSKYPKDSSSDSMNGDESPKGDDSNQASENNNQDSTSSPPQQEENNNNADCDGIALNDVAQHNTRDDCWYVLYGTVYDLTEYVDRHPGGARRVFEECGTDATATYASEHNQKLLQLEGMSRYEMGPLVVTEGGQC